MVVAVAVAVAVVVADRILEDNPGAVVGTLAGLEAPPESVSYGCQKESILAGPRYSNRRHFQKRFQPNSWPVPKYLQKEGTRWIGMMSALHEILGTCVFNPTYLYFGQ